MNWTSRRYRDVIIALARQSNAPSRARVKSADPNRQLSPASQSQHSTADRRVYEANIYCGEPLPDLSPPSNRSVAPRCVGLPLIGTEQVRLPWTRYQEYL